MADFSFIHAADIHLDSPLRGLERYEGAPVEETRGAARRALENLVELALEEEVAFVLLAGDLYDGDWTDYSTGLFFVHRMQRLDAAWTDSLDGAPEEGRYEIVPYAVLRDRWVGATRSAPVGQEPVWVPGRLIFSHHMVGLDRRIQTDLARRLREEEPLGQSSEPPHN